MHAWNQRREETAVSSLLFFLWKFAPWPNIHSDACTAQTGSTVINRRRFRCPTEKNLSLSFFRSFFAKFLTVPGFRFRLVHRMASDRSVEREKMFLLSLLAFPLFGGELSWGSVFRAFLLLLLLAALAPFTSFLVLDRLSRVNLSFRHCFIVEGENETLYVSLSSLPSSILWSSLLEARNGEVRGGYGGKKLTESNQTGQLN